MTLPIWSRELTGFAASRQGWYCARAIAERRPELCAPDSWQANLTHFSGDASGLVPNSLGTHRDPIGIAKSACGKFYRTEKKAKDRILLKAKVKSFSPHHRCAIAFHSPDGSLKPDCESALQRKRLGSWCEDATARFSRSGLKAGTAELGQYSARPTSHFDSKVLLARRSPAQTANLNNAH